MNQKYSFGFTLTEFPSLHFAGKRKIAFTLAEVLITLGIIGVVAAMTLPSIIQHYNKKVTEVRLKKFYSVMNQAVESLKSDYGDPVDWDFTIDNAYDGETNMDNLIDQNEAVAAKFEEYFGKYVEFTGKKNIEIDGKQRHLFYFKDGSALATQYYNNFDYEFFPKNPEKCLKLSASKRYGTCSFPFQFYTFTSSLYYGKFTPYFTGVSKACLTTTEGLYTGTGTGCSGTSQKGCSNSTHISGNYCGLIIMLNGWSVPNDYPRKLTY